jgi:L-alanine-DL-glutamate epimerase-like enolase superfamily enzyme
MSTHSRRNFLKGVAVAVPAATALSGFNAMAASERKKVKITDVKMMRAKTNATPTNWIKVETDAGIYGIGEAYWGLGVKELVLGYFRDYLIGEDPLDVDRHYHSMLRKWAGAGAIGGVTVTAASGVEIALWDLAGKILGAPVVKLLGGQFRDGVRAYWTGSPKDPLDPASCREFASMLKSHPFGITAIKSDADGYPRRYDPEFKESGHDSFNRNLTRKDLARIAKGFNNLREAVGEDIDIAVHCHWNYAWPDALALARTVEPIMPAWLEDPMTPDFSDSWVKLTAASPVPILMGENLYRRDGFKDFIIKGGCHIIQPDIPKAGGLLECKKIADLAELFNIPVNAHLAGTPVASVASAHSAAAMPDFRMQEFSLGFYNTDSWSSIIHYDGPIIKNGKIRILDKPGLGLELNEEVVRPLLLPGETWWG